MCVCVCAPVCVCVCCGFHWHLMDVGSLGGFDCTSCLGRGRPCSLSTNFHSIARPSEISHAELGAKVCMIGEMVIATGRLRVG